MHDDNPASLLMLRRRGRRSFFTNAAVAAAGLATTLPLGRAMAADAQDVGAAAVTDADIANFALNLEYLEAEFYLRAAYGRGLSDANTGGSRAGKVTGGSKVRFKSGNIREYAMEIAKDEEAHVKFLRSALGGAAVPEPDIDLDKSFTAAAQAAGLIKPGQKFNPFADDVSFLLGAFIFEDVGVTAYKGAAPLIKDKGILEAAAGILAVEAYHAGIVRTALYALEQFRATQAISDLRDKADGNGDKDQGLGTPSKGNLVPTDQNGIAFSRSTSQVLRIVYLGGSRSGGFFPKGLNGKIR